MINWGMYKNLNNHTLNTIKKLNIIKLLFVLFFGIWFFVVAGFGFEVKLWDALDRFYEKAQENAEIDNLNGKAIVWWLYEKSLELMKNNQMLPMFAAMEKTSKEFNKIEQCEVDTQDIVNVLYFANDEFKRDLKNNLMWFIKPNKSDMADSCNKINVCIYDPVSWKLNNSIQLNNSCQDIIEKQFIEFYVNSYYMETLDLGSKWSNLFWNASLDDSSYDIMSDVNVLSKILFEGAIQPQETLFYRMPTVDYGSVPDYSPISMEVDWFSPYNNYIINTWSDSGSGDSDWIWWWESWHDEWFDQWNGWSQDDWDINIWNDILDLIDIINDEQNLDWDNDVIVGGNQCVSGVNITWNIWYFVWGEIGNNGNDQLMDPDNYLDGVLYDIQEASCNMDNQCQSWESNDCSDCIGQWQWDDSFDQIEQLLNDAQQLWSWDEINEQVLWCFQSCQNVPCNAMSCDKLVCYAKCACQVYESPIFDPSITPGLTSVFKINFCIVPVQENTTTKDKMVYTVSSIFTELYNVLQNLRNSGELAVSVKTKEFLDTSYKENNFGEQMSFTLNSTTKPVVSKTSELTKEDAQINTNTIWMEHILWFWKDANLNTEKNKYIVMDDPCDYIVAESISGSPDDAAKLKEQCNESSSMNIEISDLDTALKDQKVILLDSEFEKFLKLNSDFWSEVWSNLSVFKSSAEVLSQK